MLKKLILCYNVLYRQNERGYFMEKTLEYAGIKNYTGKAHYNLCPAKDNKSIFISLTSTGTEPTA